MEIIYPKPSEIARYINHGIAPINIQGVEKGVLRLSPLLSAIKDNQDLEPKVFWTRGDYQHNPSNARIIVCSRDVYHRKKQDIKQNLVDAVLFGHQIPIPDEINFWKGYRSMAGRIGIGLKEKIGEL